MTDGAVQTPAAGSGYFPTLRRIFRKLLLVAIFALFPILIIQSAVFQVEKLEVEKLVESRFEQHVTMLARLKEQDDDAKMVVRSISRMLGHIASGSVGLRQAGVSRLHRLFPKTLDLYVFDARGKIIPQLSSGRHYRRSMEMAFQSLWVYRNTGKLTNEGLLKEIFNFGEIPQISRGFQAEGANLGRRPRDSILKMGRFDQVGPTDILGYLALIHVEELSGHRALRGAINRANKRLKKLGYGFLDTSKGIWDFFPVEDQSQFHLRDDILKAINRYDQFYSTSTHFGAMNRRTLGGYIFSFCRKPAFFPASFKVCLHAFCLLWFVLVWVKVPQAGQGVGGSIPIKLVALFLFAVGTPALVLLIGGFYALKDHSHVLLQQLETRVQEKLRQFDERVPSELIRLEGFLRRIIDKAVKINPGPERQAIFQEFLREEVLDTVTIINRKGEEVFNFPKYKEALRLKPEYANKNKFALIIGREVIKRLNNSMEIDSGTLMMEATSGLLNTLMGGKNVSMDLILGEFGKFQELAFQGDGAFMYLDSLPLPNGTVDHAVIGSISGVSLQGFYIKKNLADLIKQPDLVWRVSALGDYLGKGDAFSNYQRNILARPEDHDPAWQLQSSVKQSRAPVKKLNLIKGEEELWYGVRPQNLNRYTLVAAVPLKSLNRYIKNLWMLLLVVAGVVLFSTAAIGMLLSEQFLNPIADLSTGIKSIENRNFDYRVPIHAPDELGEMSSLMNTVLEGMKDLQVARIVQESLFPPDGITLGNYHIYGKSRAMTDIGGDYLDYFQVGSDKIVGLIGDVSGHGVSAALIMGMAKCAFTMHEEKLDDLVSNLTMFSRFLLRTIKRKKMMTLFHFCLDVTNNVFVFGNGGHNFPYYYIAATGGIENLKQETFPLGMRLKVEYSTRQRNMDPGDTILFYTDGLVEAKNLRQEMLDYDRAGKWFGECAHLGPREVVDAMFARFDRFTEGCEPEDDMSLICLKRLG